MSKTLWLAGGLACLWAISAAAFEATELPGGELPDAWSKRVLVAGLALGIGVVASFGSAATLLVWLLLRIRSHPLRLRTDAKEV